MVLDLDDSKEDIKKNRAPELYSCYGEEGWASNIMTCFNASNEEITKGIPVYELVQRANFAPSNTEARKLIRSKSIRANGVVIDENFIFNEDWFDRNGYLKLSKGKNRTCETLLQVKTARDPHDSMIRFILHGENSLPCTEVGVLLDRKELSNLELQYKNALEIIVS